MNIQLKNRTQTNTVAAKLVETLINLGVDSIFGYPGAAVLSIYNELSYTNKITHYLVRHEQAAIHAAEGYARSSGKVGVVLVTSGPGFTNTVTGIVNAYTDSTPLVVLAGDVSTGSKSGKVFQKVDILSMTKSCAKKVYKLSEKDDIKQVLEEAFTIANTGVKGPYVIALPRDILESEYKNKVTNIIENDIKTKDYLNAVEKLNKLLSEAKKPLVLVGGGAANSSNEIINFVEKYNLPLVSTLMGIGVFPSENELYMGMIGINGSHTANSVLNNCDLLIAFGVAFSDRTTCKKTNFGTNTKIVSVNLNLISDNFELQIKADVKEFLQQYLSKHPSPLPLSHKGRGEEMASPTLPLSHKRQGGEMVSSTLPLYHEKQEVEMVSSEIPLSHKKQGEEMISHNIPLYNKSQGEDAHLSMPLYKRRDEEFAHISLPYSRNIKREELTNLSLPLTCLKRADLDCIKQENISRQDWLNQIKTIKEEFLTDENSTKCLHSSYVLAALSEYTRKYEPIVVTDVGQHQMLTAQFYNFNKPRKFITSGGLGTMGFGLPAAIGAHIANPENLILNITGDGSFQMNLQELATCREHNIPVKIIIMNNGYLGMVRQMQEKIYNNRYQVEMTNPDFVKIAEAYDLFAIRVTNKNELIPAINKAIQHNGTAIVDIMIDSFEEI